eukprot:3453373-Rhodomonas_salina.1
MAPGERAHNQECPECLERITPQILTCVEVMLDTWPAFNQCVERMDAQMEFQYQLDNQEFESQLQEPYRMQSPVIPPGQKDQLTLTMRTALSSSCS